MVNWKMYSVVEFEEGIEFDLINQVELESFLDIQEVKLD